MISFPMVIVTPVALSLAIALGDIEFAPRPQSISSTPNATQRLSGVKVPNTETQEALRQTYERKGLTESNSLNDLISLPLA